ncbi:MAG: hypothetical protein GTO02_02080 [Candidatus Dadabacteria bacterium]|nr:hypothetical protein [Candidatus Dadabacteria bacterium]NIQ13225.1 hypothetical protein [Candidatus Dadabacteria bacterium]
MKSIRYLIFAFLLLLPLNAFSGIPPDNLRHQDLEPEEELVAYYDLRNRSTYVQVTNVLDNNPLCIHIQIFQQDRDCSELNFNDTLTPNDTVVYNMDNLIRNDGSEVPAELLDDSYGYVVVSAYQCSNNDDDAPGVRDSIIGNFRIIDDSGYEYRTNMVGNASIDEGGVQVGLDKIRDVIIPFNKVDGATHADIVGFVWENDANLNGESLGNSTENRVRNLPRGVTFSVFQVDEDEERLSCDTANFACGTGKIMNYGVNDDFPASRGNNVLCEGGGLAPNQSHGYFSLENASVSDGDQVSNEQFEFTCFVGLNNNNGTGSMDNCSFSCAISDPECIPPP